METRPPQQYPAITRITRILEERLAEGYYSVGAWLPAERDLAAELSVSRPVIRAALSSLAERGLIAREPGCRPRVAVSASLRNANGDPGEALAAADVMTARDMIAAVVPQAPTYASAHAILCGIASVLQQEHAPYNLTVFDSWIHRWVEDVTAITAPFHLSVFQGNPAGEGVAALEDQAELERSILDRAERARFAGVIIWHLVEAPTLSIIQRLEEKGIAVVFIDRFPPTLDCDYVGVDNQSGMRDAVDHLLDLGHTRIAYVTNDEQANPVQEREEGYREALRARGISPSPELIYINPMCTGDNMAQAFAHLSSLPDPPTAVACMHDIFAFGMINEARAHGWRVPGDLSVVGFDDIESLSPHPAMLTTVHQPFYQIGQRAAKLLFRRLNPSTPGRGRTYQHVLLPTSLVIRSTTGPMPGGRR